MNTDIQALPEFENPPVVEVAISVQFARLDLAPAQIGKYAIDLAECGYPKIETHPPIVKVMERFGENPSTEATPDFQSPQDMVRHWFASEDKTRLIQLQRDRFVHNWRKLGTAVPYPRFDTLRSEFQTRLSEFVSFTESQGIGSIEPDQCEVTYVNHIRPSGVWSTFKEMSKAVGISDSQFSDTFLPNPHDMRANARFIIAGTDDKPIGRLHVSCQCARDSETNEPLFVLTVIARGAPLGNGIDGAMKFIDVARQWVVRGFASVTTPAMHEAWGRTQ